MHLIEEEQKPIEIPIDTRTEEEKKADKEKYLQVAKARAEEAKREELAKERQEKLEVMAQEWAEREFFRRSLKGDLAVNQKQFVDMIQERAMFEAELELREMEGEDIDILDEERDAWKKAQQAKVKAGLKASMEKMKKKLRQEIDSV